jgi:ATP-binding protein involved in chromosome partitioning
MPDVTQEQILEALKAVTDPDRGGNIVDLNMVQGLTVNDGKVSFAIEVDPARGPELEGLRQAAEDAAKSVPDVKAVAAILTAERPAPQLMPDSPAEFSKLQLPTIKSVVAVASGKGGVGKSTTAVNLALALAAAGKSVGIIDADIYGPSIPRMLGITEQPVQSESGQIVPLRAHGIECIRWASWSTRRHRSSGGVQWPPALWNSFSVMWNGANWMFWWSICRPEPAIFT